MHCRAIEVNVQDNDHQSVMVREESLSFSVGFFALLFVLALRFGRWKFVLG